MVTAIWVILGACMMVVVEAQVSCPGNYVPSEESSSCVKVFVTYGYEHTWYEARDECRLDGGDLVKILNQAMNDFIYDMAMSDTDFLDQGLRCTWIGLNDPNSDNTWIWLDEEDQAAWTNWAYDQPDNSDQDCAVLDTAYSGEWRDLDCYDGDNWSTESYLCEIPALTTTKETTTNTLTSESTTSTTITLETTRTSSRTTMLPTTTNDIHAQSRATPTPEPTTTNDSIALSTTTDASDPTTTNDITANSTTTTAPVSTTNAKSFTVSTTDSVSPPTTETGGTTGAISLGMGSLYTYLLLAIVVVLGLILIVHTAMFLQRCYFGNRIIRKISEPATSLERRKHLVQFSNTVYDFPDGEQGTVF